MSGFQFSPETLTFGSTFAGIPVVIGYEIEVSEDHRGRDVEIIPTVCVIGEAGVDLCEDAGFFHPEQLKTWLTQAEADYNGLLADDGEPDDYADPWAGAAAEDRWIAQLDRAHYSRAGL
ncbi:hypothetical protein [Azohydromonas australica]|uniref:hypothetical protein n=1 Tax=Azohydromonas australica TaxID=364039 RepID=UPI00041C7C68|nr:hypothetical protein [Azohydromonas australica]